MNKKRVIAGLLTVAMVLTMTPVQADAKAKSKTKVSKVTVANELYGKKLYVAKGKKVTLKTKVDVTPNKKANKKVTFKSKNSKIVKVDKKGKLTAKKLGTTKITITSKLNKKKKATVSVKVTNPIKSVSLDKKDLILEEGKTATLKATVAPTKKVCTFVKWTSSNDKVATVDANGNIKAIAAGKAVIKATSVDGTKKFAVCNVTVNKAATTQQKTTEKKTTEKTTEKTTQEKDTKKNGISSISFDFDEENFNYAQSIVVTLDDAIELAKTDFNVKVKFYNDDNLRKRKITKVEKLKNNQYRLWMEDAIDHGDTYVVTIDKLSGKQSLEAVCIAPDENLFVRFLANVNEPQSVFLFEPYVPIKDKKEVGELPEGLSLICEDGYYAIEGECTSDLSSYDSYSVIFTDELGKKYTYQIAFEIIGKNRIYTENIDYVSPIISIDDGAFFEVSCYGGSGEYNVSLSGQYAELFNVNTVECNTILIYTTHKLEPGEYNLEFTVTDRNNPEVTQQGYIRFNVIKGNRILLNSNGGNYHFINSVNGEEVDAIYGGEDVVYVPDGTYDIYVEEYRFYVNHLRYSSLVIDQDMDLDITLDYYYVSGVVSNVPEDALVRVRILVDEEYAETVVAPDPETGKAEYIIDNIPEGDYTIDMDLTSVWRSYYTDGITDTLKVENGNKEYNATMPKVELKGPYVVGNMTGVGTYKGETQDCVQYISFTPSESGSYTIYSVSECDLVGVVRNADGELIAENDDVDDDNYDFEMTCSLTKGVTYYIGVSQYSYESSENYKIVIEK